MFTKRVIGILATGAALIPAVALAGSWLPPASGDTDYLDGGMPPAARVELGRLLFFDKVLSGNLNISCATCHHPLAGTGDGLSLGIGEGGRGLGATRDAGSGRQAVHERVPRNAPPLFNLGALEFERLFHDGRIEADPFQGDSLISPAGADLPTGLNSALAAQAMFPVTSGTEMAGQAGENPQADAAAAGRLSGSDGVWGIIARKLRAIPGYREPFMAAFPDEIREPADIAFHHAANAIAAFEAFAWRSDNSRFDHYLHGDHQALSAQERLGMKIFYGKGACGNCHSGTFQTDHEFYAVAMPQIGPGKGDGEDGLDDFGRERVTGNSADRYRFRTPSLRNIALTAPYGHSGAFDTLQAVVAHHLDSVTSLQRYDPSQVTLPPGKSISTADFAIVADPQRREAIALANELEPVMLTEAEFRALLAFLHALTDPGALDMRGLVPPTVPSGLPVWD